MQGMVGRGIPVVVGLLIGLGIGFGLANLFQDSTFLIGLVQDYRVRWVASILVALGSIMLSVYSAGLSDEVKGDKPWRQLPKTIFLPLLIGIIFIAGGTSLVAYEPPADPHCASFIVDTTVEDDQHLSPGEQFVKSWRLYNCGGTDWINFEAKLDRGTLGPAGIVINATAKTDVILQTEPITAPREPGCYYSRYRLQAPNGVKFGDYFWFIVAVGPPGPKIDYVAYIDHGNVRKSTLMASGEDFTKQWIFRNCGDNTWEGYRARRISGEIGPEFIEMPLVSPHQYVTLYASMEAPEQPNSYESVYQLENAQGDLIGEEFYVNIKVQ